MKKDILIQILQKLKRFWQIFKRQIKKILQILRRFYEHIFVNKFEVEKFLKRQNMHSHVTIKEIKIIKILPTKKTPGPGDFNSEFSQKHWRKKRCQCHTNSSEEQEKREHSSPHFETHITLIPRTRQEGQRHCKKGNIKGSFTHEQRCKKLETKY